MTPPQRLLDRYELQQCLGQSLFARTYAAQDLKENQPVIVKALNLSHLDAWKNLELFQREAKVLAHLEHPAIPRLLDAFEQGEDSDRAFYLVQEKVTGENLKQKFDKGWRPDQAQAAEIARQVLKILAYLQSFSPPIVHRDLKPSNLMLDAKGKVWLIDFGAVQELLKPRGGSTVVGTYGYMAPEQFSGQAVPASDLYSLGATLVHLMTGTAPSELPQNRMKISFEAHLQGSDAFKVWLGQLLEPTVAKRCPSAAEALQSLRELKKATALQPAPERPWLPVSQPVNQIREPWQFLSKGSGLLDVSYYREGLRMALPTQKRSIFSFVSIMLKMNLLFAPVVGGLGFLILQASAASDGFPFIGPVGFLIAFANFTFGAFVYSTLPRMVKAHELTVTPYLITQGQFFLPTHLLQELIWYKSPSLFDTLPFGDLLFHWKDPMRQSVSKSSGASLTRSDGEQKAQQEAGSFNSHGLSLFLTDAENQEAVEVINRWIRQHAKEIAAASKTRLDQALLQLTPLHVKSLQVSLQEGVVTIDLRKAAAQLKLLPEALQFSNASGKRLFPWKKITQIRLGEEIDTDYENPVHYCLLILETQNAEPYEIWRLRVSEANVSAMVWLRDMLNRFCPKAHQQTESAQAVAQTEVPKEAPADIAIQLYDPSTLERVLRFLYVFLDKTAVILLGTWFLPALVWFSTSSSAPLSFGWLIGAWLGIALAEIGLCRLILLFCRNRWLNDSYVDGSYYSKQSEAIMEDKRIQMQLESRDDP